MTLSKSYTWKDQAGKTQTGSSNIDVLQALGVVEKTGGDNGVPWAGGTKAGGQGQPPIKLVSDVARAGYNIEQNQTLNILGKDDGDTASLVAKSWKNPQDAVAFAVAVLGDMEIATKSGATPNVTPGHGLLPQIEKDRAAISTKLAALVKGDAPPTPDNLAQASSPHTVLNRDVLEAIRKLSPAEQPIAVGKLASEAAVAANVERALMLRRLLLAGWGEPHIYAAGVGEDIHRLVAILDREVDQLLYESRVRKELLTSTAAALLEMGGQEDARPTTPYQPGDAKPVINSGVKK
jgi:integrating conjugative element protein (TIGR03755 family)